MGFNRRPLELAVRERQESLALATWKEATEDLVELTEDIDPLETQRRRALAAVADARYNDAVTRLQAARERLPREVDLRQVDVVLSQEIAADALEDYQGAVLRAPFAGVVALVNVDPDDQVTRDSRIVEIVDPTFLEVASFVEAANAKLISTGDRAKITIDSRPDDVFTSAVFAISDKPRTERGIISYAITIAVDVPVGTEIPIALSSVSVVVSLNDKGVLLAPRGAVGGSDWRPVF